MEFSSESKAHIVQFFSENKDFVTGDDNDKWNELLNSLADIGVIGVSKEDVQKLWEQLRDSTITKVKTSQSLDEVEQLIVTILSHSDDAEEVENSAEVDMKHSDNSFKQKTSSRSDVMNLKKRKLQLECKTLQGEMDKIPLECAKLELEIQSLQQKLLCSRK